MTVAEMVIERADKQTRFSELLKETVDRAKRQEGDPETTLDVAQLEELAAAIASLTIRINKANNKNGNMERIARRDYFDRQTKALKAIRDAAIIKPGTAFRQSASEIKWVSNTDVDKLGDEINALSADRREINVQIQKADWQE